jgi:hypothetical protein
MNVEAFSSKGQKLTLKEPTGWFAAGESFRRALLLLSDGAFKMFAYLCLQADRRTARVETTHRELAQALGKSKRAIGTYVGELEKHRICCAHAGETSLPARFSRLRKTIGPTTDWPRVQSRRRSERTSTRFAKPFLPWRADPESLLPLIRKPRGKWRLMAFRSKSSRTPFFSDLAENTYPGLTADRPT